MKKKVIFSSIVSIILCFSLICGATYGLFVSESKVNLAISSGNISVSAYLKDEPTLSSETGVNLPQTSVNYSKTNNKLEISYLMPGDCVDFSISIFNESNVDMKYQTIIEAVSDDGLFSGLEITIDGNVFTGTEKVESEWSDAIQPSADTSVAIKEIPIKIKLPYTAGNEYANKTAVLTYTVSAMQANGYVGPKANITRQPDTEMPEENEITILGGASLGVFNLPPVADDWKTEASWVFKTTETEEQVQESKYKNWLCDFVIWSDDQTIEYGELGLFGLYGNYAFGFANPIAIDSQNKFPILVSIALGINNPEFLMTYEMVCTYVKEFTCGVFKNNESISGKTIHVALCIADVETVNSNDINDYVWGDTIRVVNETVYTFS